MYELRLTHEITYYLLINEWLFFFFFLRIYTLEDKGVPVAITAYHGQKKEMGYFLSWSG